MAHHTQTERSFTLTRNLQAPRHLVFKAWTDSEHLAWFYNPAMPAPASPIEVDLRVGGAWRQQMVVNEELHYPTGGEYLEIVPDVQLVFRWGAVGGWPDLTGDHQREAPIVSVNLTDAQDGTRLELTVNFPDHLPAEEVRNLIDGGTRDGWGATLDRITHSTALTA
ncbi:SRPBCC family protein [Arthrobacter sp. Sr33]